MLMRIILCLAVFGILAAIWFGWKKAKSEVEKEKTPNSKFSSGWDAQIIAVIAAWSVMCAIIGGLLARCTEKPSKEVTLTVVDKAADKDSVTTYFRLSDGYTVKISSSIGSNAPYDDWVMVKKGDKVRKLIFESQPTRYTPVFDENILK